MLFLRLTAVALRLRLVGALVAIVRRSGRGLGRLGRLGRLGLRGLGLRGLGLRGLGFGRLGFRGLRRGVRGRLRVGLRSRCGVAALRERIEPDLQGGEVHVVGHPGRGGLGEVDDHVQRLEEEVAELRRVGELAVAHLDHDVLEAVRDVRDLYETDHARRALEGVRVAQHLLDERPVARLRLEHDDALVEALEEVGGLLLELAYERAAVELDHRFLFTSGVLAGPARYSTSLNASPIWLESRAMPASISAEPATCLLPAAVCW